MKKFCGSWSSMLSSRSSALILVRSVTNNLSGTHDSLRQTKYVRFDQRSKTENVGGLTLRQDYVNDELNSTAIIFKAHHH